MRSGGAIKTVCNMQIEGKRGDDLKDTHRDSREWNFNKVDPCDRDVSRSVVRSAMHADSQLLGKDFFLNPCTFSGFFSHPFLTQWALLQFKVEEFTAKT